MLQENDFTYIDSLQDNFDKIYILYFPRMFAFAKEYVLFDEDAENIVQDVFMLLWEKRRILNIEISLTSYLLTLVKNRCINLLQHKLTVEEYSKNKQEEYNEELSFKLYSLEQFNHHLAGEDDILLVMEQAIAKLPPKCREIFIKCKIEGLKYKQIAEELNITVNTVENQISIALKKLRIELKNYLPILLFML